MDGHIFTHFGELVMQATTSSPARPSRPPQRKRKRGRKKRQGFGKQVGSNKRDSDDTTNSSEFSDSDGFDVRVKKEGASGVLASRGLRSIAGGSGYHQGNDPAPSSERDESTPAVKRRKVLSDFKSEPGQILLGISPITADRPRKKKRIPFTLVEASKGNRCPTEGCEGLGHITGLYAMHFAVSGCPIARGKTAEECKARRKELNRLLSKSIPNEGEEESRSGGGVVPGERSLRRTQRSTMDDLVGGGRASVASLSIGRKAQAQVSKLYVCFAVH